MQVSSENREARPYELVVWGATGFVGRLICEYLLERYGNEVRWAMAARSREKLEALRRELGPAAGEIPVLVADAADRASLDPMVASTDVLLSTVGPYALYGSELVAACAAAGTDYCDLAGETPWIRQMIDAHQAAAEASGARIVPCCGFDSIPSDLGVHFLQGRARARFGQPCTSIRMRVKAAKGGVSGGTIASMLGILEAAANDPATARLLRDPYALCPDGMRDGPRQASGNAVLWDEDAGAWAAPFVMAAINTRVVHRSNALSDYFYGREFRYEEMMLTGAGLTGQAGAWATALGLGAFTLAAGVAPLRSLMNRLFLPQPGQGPDKATRESGFYDLRFHGRTASGDRLVARVTGDRDPGYGSTAKMIVESGLCLARDVSRDERRGGLWTPATAMGDALVARLVDNAGLEFTLLDAGGD